MITYQNVRWWHRAWLIVPVLGVIAAAGGWWWLGARGAGDAGAAASASDAAGAQRKPTPVESALLVEPQVMPDGRPADFTPEDWASLKAAMARTPNPTAELERVVKYLRFQKGFEQWQSLQDGSDTLKRKQLAERLLDQVPDRLRQSEMTWGEASLLQATLLADLEPNEDLRKQKLDALQEQLKAAAPQVDAQQAARDEDLEREYKRREAAIVADYQSRPEAQRNHDKLEADLDAARRAVWGAKK